MSNDGFREHLEGELEFARKQITRAAAKLAQEAERIGHVVDRTADPIISEIGELRARGPMFDAACARYATLRQVLKDYDAYTAGAMSGQGQRANG